MDRSNNGNSQTDWLARETDRCVRCGLCLPECPTYRLTANENESPRGRLALIEGLIGGQLEADAALVRHLDNCLLCRRCERVCPSQVGYGGVMDAARARLPRRTGRYLTRLLQRPALQQLAVALGRSISPWMSRPLGRLHGLHLMARAMPAAGPAPPSGVYGGTGRRGRGCIGLFAGCTGRALQPAALRAACRLVRRAGFNVEIARHDACCGALSAHAGDERGARLAADRVNKAYAHGFDGIVSIASGCGIHLDAYRPPLAATHRDVCRFLLEEGGFVAADFVPLQQRVALHVPCSVENVYGGADWARHLLGLLPGIELITVGEPGQCCGAAGDHMLRKPAASARLRQPLLDGLAATGADVLVSSNVGCAVHLAAGLRGQGTAVEVLHPVELLARQLR